MYAYAEEMAIALFALAGFYGIAWFPTRGRREVSRKYGFSGLAPSRLCPPLLIPWDDIAGIERRGLATG
jgi:hypothetical protein